MNTVSASARPARICHMRIFTQIVRKLGDLFAPRDHFGRGAWSNDADIPSWVGWLAGVALTTFLWNDK